MRPAKVIAFPAKYPSQQYLEWLAVEHPRFHKKLIDWIKLHTKFPTKLIINPALDKVPVEIRGLIDIKHLIELNVKPAYSVLNQLNINCGSSMSNVLFSELYNLKN
jgi:hypothetical protein